MSFFFYIYERWKHRCWFKLNVLITAPRECHQLIQALHEDSVFLKEIPDGSGFPQNVSCIDMLEQWDKQDSRKESYVRLASRLREINRNDLADKVSKAILKVKFVVISEWNFIQTLLRAQRQNNNCPDRSVDWLFITVRCNRMLCVKITATLMVKGQITKPSLTVCSINTVHNYPDFALFGSETVLNSVRHNGCIVVGVFFDRSIFCSFWWWQNVWAKH